MQTAAAAAAAVIVPLIAVIKFGFDLYDRYKESKKNNNRSNSDK